MTGPANSTPAQDGGFLAPRPGAGPVDHCFRCGRETPAGVGLCEEHNPHHLSGPSSTQMHATIFGGIVLGVLAFFIVARLAVSSTGPFASEVGAASVADDGSAAVTFSVTNEGDGDAAADCRVTRDGVPRPDDLAFRSAVIASGETATFERQLPVPPPGPIGYDAESLTVVCR